MTKVQKERLQYSPDALAGYFHFSVYLIPPGGTVDVIASGFRLEGQRKESGRRQQPVAEEVPRASLGGWRSLKAIETSGVAFALIEGHPDSCLLSPCGNILQWELLPRLEASQLFAAVFSRQEVNGGLATWTNG